MPYTLVNTHNKYCVHKKNADGSAGKRVACHATKQDAIDQIGAIESAEKVVAEKSMDEIVALQSDVLSHIVWVLLWEDRTDDAYTVVTKIEEAHTKIRCLVRLASHVASSDKDRAQQYYEQALQSIRALEDYHAQAYHLANLADSMADSGFVDQALEIAYSLSGLTDQQKSALVTHLKAKALPPEDRTKSYVMFKQDDNGDWWFIGLYSNKFKDRHAEIISEEAHKEYVEWVKSSGIKPQITLFHMPRAEPGFWYQVVTAYEKGMIRTDTMNTMLRDFYKDYALAESERVFYANGFVGVVGKVYKERESWINNLVNYKDSVGMSHGFIPRELNDNIYTKYRSFEMSVLPKSRAANAWTNVLLVEGKPMPLNQEDKEFLDNIKQGASNEIDALTAATSQELETKGVEFKEADDTPEEVTVDSVVKLLVETMKWDEFGQALSKQLTDIADRFTAIEKRLETVEKTEDEKVANLYQPNWQQFLPKTDGQKTDDKSKSEAPFNFLNAILPQAN